MNFTENSIRKRYFSNIEFSFTVWYIKFTVFDFSSSLTTRLTNLFDFGHNLCNFADNLSLNFDLMLEKPNLKPETCPYPTFLHRNEVTQDNEKSRVSTPLLAREGVLSSEFWVTIMVNCLLFLVWISKYHRSGLKIDVWVGFSWQFIFPNYLSSPICWSRFSYILFLLSHSFN